METTVTLYSGGDAIPNRITVLGVRASQIVDRTTGEARSWTELYYCGDTMDDDPEMRGWTCDRVSAVDNGRLEKALRSLNPGDHAMLNWDVRRTNNGLRARLASVIPLPAEVKT